MNLFLGRIQKDLNKKSGLHNTRLYRHTGGGDPRARHPTEQPAERRTKQRHPPARGRRPRHPGRALQGCLDHHQRPYQWHPLQRTNDRPHDARILRPGCRLLPPPQHRHGATGPLGPRLQPYPQGGPHHSRPRSRTANPTAPHRRSRGLSQPRPRKLGRMKTLATNTRPR